MDEIAKILLMQEVSRRMTAGAAHDQAATAREDSASEQRQGSPATERPDLIDVLVDKLRDEGVRKALARLLSGR